jgi:hypothetical protein
LSSAALESGASGNLRTVSDLIAELQADVVNHGKDRRKLLSIAKNLNHLSAVVIAHYNAIPQQDIFRRPYFELGQAQGVRVKRYFDNDLPVFRQ